jgi:hypothetical protein
MAKIQVKNLFFEQQMQQLDSDKHEKIYGGDLIVFYRGGTAIVYTCGCPDVAISFDPNFRF